MAGSCAWANSGASAEACGRSYSAEVTCKRMKRRSATDARWNGSNHLAYLWQYGRPHGVVFDFAGHGIRNWHLMALQSHEYPYEFVARPMDEHHRPMRPPYAKISQMVAAIPIVHLYATAFHPLAGNFAE